MIDRGFRRQNSKYAKAEAVKIPSYRSLEPNFLVISIAFMSLLCSPILGAAYCTASLWQTSKEPETGLFNQTVSSYPCLRGIFGWDAEPVRESIWIVNLFARSKCLISDGPRKYIANIYTSFHVSWQCTTIDLLRSLFRDNSLHFKVFYRFW